MYKFSNVNYKKLIISIMWTLVWMSNIIVFGEKLLVDLKDGELIEN
ncbi:MAG: hypothetical protein Q9M94_03985 [Candidatus Gracilibacteria bacterium]|nr:hypothetical protein [Candidatus Gracilibacteria bacterium]MDQ7023239.1 hypothetical protein [Candidatus Gracilibacteria bacterium]